MGLAVGIDLMKLALYKAAVEDTPENYYKVLGQQSMAVEDDGLQVMPNGNTVLHVAALHGRQHFVENILQGKDNNHAAVLSLLFAQNKKNESALHCAAENGHANIVSILISATKEYMDVESGVGLREMVQMTDNVMDMALHKAVRMGHLEVVEKLLVEEDDEFVYPPNNAGETPIYIAARLGFRDCLQQLLNSCKNPTYNGPLGRNALHATASLVSSQGCTELILKKEISLCDMTDDSGWTPLHYAIKNQYNEVARMILAEKYCSAYHHAGKDDMWTTVFHIAARYGNVEMMEYISNSCFPDCWMVLNSKSQNILHEAILGHRLNVIEYVLKYSQADNLIEGKDENGNTPLALLSICSCNPLKRVAMQGVMWKHLVFNKQHQTPFVMASQNRKWAFSKYFFGWKLLRRGGKIGCQSGLTENKIERKECVGTEKDIDFMVETGRTNIIAASLILTTTFTAGLTAPGGYNSSTGKTQGTSILLHCFYFQTFVIFDFIAFSCSIMSIFLHIMMIAEASSTKNFKFVKKYFALSQFLVVYAALFAIGAFMFGMAATLAPLHSLTTVVQYLGVCSAIGFGYVMSQIFFVSF
ncbi:serine/threonine-protein phosphatase 6 regulatory ankyrin repeat subunit A-like [Ipomoea triloba]|uniref:serine/threonine-protein phosphatase 6 regulatory ankyrin repeat subunit A-like n=1 Tax=Ipomoea triloba TaxID=35885 RepID=UPI00125E3B1E|nr:serine/threonine-protein phosphatase 6 regulatory ankyrin repeat subunit A-like [Ipomoea triloba]